MRHNYFAVFILTAILIGCAKPNIINQSFESGKIVHISRIKALDNLNDYVVYLDKGDSIPLKLSLESDILDIADDEINFVLKKKIYFRLAVPDALKNEEASSMSEAEKKAQLKKVKIFLSPDAVNWAPYTDIKAVEQVLGIKGGFFSAGMGISKEQGITAFLKAKVNSIKQVSP